MASSKFSKILYFFQILLTILGLNVLTDFSSQNIFNKLNRLFWIFDIFLYDFVFCYNFGYNAELSVTDKFVLIICIVAVTEEILRVLILFVKHKEFKFLYQWLQELHETVQNEITKELSAVSYHKLGLSLIKTLKIVSVFFVINIILTVSAPAMTNRYDFITPSSIPWIPKDSSFYYPVNYIHQCISTVWFYAFMNSFFFFFYSLSKHILTELDIIIEISSKIGNIEDDRISKIQNSPLLDEPDNKTLKQKSNNESKSKISDTTTVLRVILEKHIKIMHVIGIASDFYSINFLYIYIIW